jgi:hypothetical protein
MAVRSGRAPCWRWHARLAQHAAQALPESGLLPAGAAAISRRSCPLLTRDSRSRALPELNAWQPAVPATSLTETAELCRSECRRVCRSVFLVASRRVRDSGVRLRTDGPGRREPVNDVQASCWLPTERPHLKRISRSHGLAPASAAAVAYTPPRSCLTAHLRQGKESETG